MSEKRATRDSWQHLPMPQTRVPLIVSHTFTDDEYQRMQVGVIPRDMDDRWFIYFEDGWLFFHRSWTGSCIYQIRLQRQSSGWYIAEAWANGDPDQFKAPQDTQLLLDTIQHILLTG